MKKILTLVTTSVILMSLFTGCGSQNNSTSTQASTTTTTQSSSSTTSNQNKKMPDLAGEVTAISGSEVTLKLIELPAMNSDKNSKSQDGQSTNSSASTSTQSTQQADQKTTGNAPSDQSGQKPSGQPGERPKMEVKYTGETKTIKISDGVSITTFNKGENGGTEKTITVKDIKVGDRLDISYSDSNKTTISKVSVRAAQQSQAQTQSQN
ncbi:hypothetical protein [Clostridium magnum]|uniref:DUF5666 domain-containing protein n=1 Tax=Clostridium magnum DSM 2767 TaxID=1121326 RepID=A0A162SB62_9CLOT|nr:hypothetical protein [Clostridium magnum]KZL91009.1 hypothetical protein CLMAG_39200 [Clostridium magnum DSM 2767]SHI65716.1 hypothetical protein SAMN02745944_04644 [Clostridium magnum DSM 2767]